MKIWLAAILWALFTIQRCGAADWTPPDDPEPQKILDEAQIDAQAGRFETALAKHIWYHRNALKYDSAQGGVRLSFALSSWKQLADQFPPALDDLKAERDATKERVLEGKNFPHCFGDLAGINRVLGEEKQTAETFVVLDRDRPAQAILAYLWAEDALLQEKQYDLCGKYCDPDQAYRQALRNYKDSKRHVLRTPESLRLLQSSEARFTRRAATIVALMVITKRHKEAELIADKAKDAIDWEPHRKAIDDALAGQMPKPQ
ncbi:hypothetical protein Pan44_15170 [Caulifigura coniformis]|uniref:Tetratricopeptide repeat protein n=1 Tax=Caulifigura coniformis TaxID=2527983 RepID=A0A517SBK0_9PLAN|nr:hypothetical protein [Caulifigura coniformis]QDT53495.1 hypothetical protein Pan44_15170 [Caulifigura coniformis]